MYLLGRPFTLETDPKPLIFPPRVLHFHLCLMRYDYQIIHVAGKAFMTADTLSRAPLRRELSEATDLQEAVELFVSTVVESLPASADRLEGICLAQRKDPVLSQVMQFVRMDGQQSTQSKVCLNIIGVFVVNCLFTMSSVTMQ